MQHTAINAKYQRAVERLYKADRKLCAFINANQVKLEKLDPDSDKYWDTEQRLIWIVRLTCSQSSRSASLMNCPSVS